MRRVSKKRQAENRRYFRWRKDELGRRGWQCEARVVDECLGSSSQLHHILSRSQGGPLMDPDNVMSVCLYCHEWIERHPIEAASKGWKRSPWGGQWNE
jgi:hypothetical protein